MFGSLTTFELRDFDKNTSKKETSFKVSEKEKDDEFDLNDHYEMEENFVRILKKGTDK